MNAVYSIAAGFITACPSTNAALPVMAYKSLTLVSGEPTAQGAQVVLQPASAPTGTYYVTVVSGLDITSVKADSATGGIIRATIPMSTEGQSYVFLTSVSHPHIIHLVHMLTFVQSNGTVTDADVLFGPAIIESTPGAPTFSLSVM